MVEYSACARAAGSFRGLESDRGDFADLRGVVVGHALEKECCVSGGGCLHLVPYGVTIMGTWHTDGSVGYGGGLAPVYCPCLGDGACGRLEGGDGVCKVKCFEAYEGVQDPREVGRQALV